METKFNIPEQKAEWQAFVGAHADAYTLFDGEVWTVFHDIPVNPPMIPESVTPWQMRKALNASGKRALVDALLANPQTPRDVIDGWEVASEWRRYDPVLLMMAQQLGMTSGDIDALFTLAATL